MAAIEDLIERVRTELGDLEEDFVVPETGGRDVIELGVRNVRPETVQVNIVTPPNTNAVVLNPSQYTLKERTGILVLHEVPPPHAAVTVTGSHYPLFSDKEIQRFINDALIQHTRGRKLVTRYRDDAGRIRYKREDLTLENLPEEEVEPLAILATIEALWSATTDAATDMDVVTSEGTHLRRSQRYTQMLEQIDRLTERYQMFCNLLGIGLYRIEQRQLRRISLMTGRLVPVFRPREYDEWDMPERILPPVEVVHEDESGIPSPILGSWGF